MLANQVGRSRSGCFVSSASWSSESTEMALVSETDSRFEDSEERVTESEYAVLPYKDSRIWFAPLLDAELALLGILVILADPCIISAFLFLLLVFILVLEFQNNGLVMIGSLERRVTEMSTMHLL